MSNSLQGKKVLYVAPRFFGYEKEIEVELVRRGAEVDFVLDRPFDTPLMKAITKVRRDWIISSAERYYSAELNNLGNKEYDLVFVISGQTLSATTLACWRAASPAAKFILYMWDSFANRRSAVDNLHFFDHCFSFDKNDSVKYGLNFRPLFFSPGFEVAQQVDPKFDISFVGTAHTDRYAVVSAVRQKLGNKVSSFWYLFLQAKWVFWIYKIINPVFRKAKISDFNFLSLSKSAVQEIFSSSKAILDIEHPLQTGLTMRTLEALGSKKKLITTNSDVSGYDFFSPENICVIDRGFPEIPADFLSGSYVDVSPEIYQKYRLEGWVSEILDIAS